MFNMTEICTATSISDEEIVDHFSCGGVRDGFDWRLVDECDELVPVGDCRGAVAPSGQALAVRQGLLER